MALFEMNFVPIPHHIKPTRLLYDLIRLVRCSKVMTLRVHQLIYALAS